MLTDAKNFKLFALFQTLTLYMLAWNAGYFFLLCCTISSAIFITRTHRVRQACLCTQDGICVIEVGPHILETPASLSR